jgi:ADP-ribosylation factor-like protein 5B
VGLNNAGKTTILYKLALNEVIVTQPTIGSNVEEVHHNNLRMQVWDLGGQESLRHTWDAYYQNTNAVIYVIDSADDSNIKASKHEFFSMLLHNDLRDAAILIFANKSDLPTARDVGEITDLYGLHMVTDHDWKL